MPAGWGNPKRESLGKRVSSGSVSKPRTPGWRGSLPRPFSYKRVGQQKNPVPPA